LPFSTAELDQALLARLPPAEPSRPPRLKVEPASAGAVMIQVGDRRRLVKIGERTGPAAARIVALVIAELLNDDGAGDTSNDAGAEPTAADASVSPASNEPPAASNEPPPASYERPAPSLVAVPSPAPSPPAPPQRLCLTGGLTEGMGSEEPRMYTVDADVLLPFEYKGVRLAPSAGLAWRTTRLTATWYEVSYTAVVARLLGGTSIGWVDLFGGPFVVGYSIGGINPNAGYLFGAEALARVSVPLSTHVRFVVATRGHAYADRVRVAYPNDIGFATPRFELSLGIGLGWDWAS
jgi:hypothetical protein